MLARLCSKSFLQYHMNWELANVQAGFRKGRGMRDQTSIFVSSTMLKPSVVWIMTNCGKLLKRPPYLSPEKPVCGSRSNSQNLVWKNRLVQDWERSTTRLFIVTCLFNLHTENIMQNARLNVLQAGIKIVGRNIYNLRYADTTTLMAKSEEELNSLLMRVKEESERASLKLNIKKKNKRSWHLAPLLHGKQSGKRWK